MREYFVEPSVPPLPLTASADHHQHQSGCSREGVKCGSIQHSSSNNNKEKLGSYRT